jgi:undecaprenyl pyrophosphate phosphatase UppP
MAFCAVAREEGRVVCLIVTTIVTTDVAFLAHTKIDDQLVESMTTTNVHVLFSIMDIVAGFHQCRKVAAGPGAHVPTELERM